MFNLPFNLPLLVHLTLKSGRLSGRNSARGNNSARGEGGLLRSKSQMQSRLHRIDSVSLLNKNGNLLRNQIKSEVPDHLRTDGYVKKIPSQIEEDK